jgi:Na+/H+ antiporter
MHEIILLCIGLVLSVSILVIVAQKLKIAYPIFLALAGLVIGFIPGIPTIHIDPDLVFLVILPPILYEASHSISLKALWTWRRIISVMAIGYVLFTTVAVAFVSHWLIPGFSLAQGFLLGAIISPPDAAAATTVLKYTRIPKGLVSILEGESLLNDATSLTIFRFALAAILTANFAWHKAAGGFALVVISGIGIGLIFGLVFNTFFKWIRTTANLTIAVSLVIPYAMYIAAEAVHSSGVLAVVSGGLFIAYQNHFNISHSSRLKSGAIWTSLVFILNAVVFFLIGLQLPTIIEDLKGMSLMSAIGVSLVVTLVVILTRMVSGLSSAAFTRFISKYITVAQSKPGWRNPVLVSWIGMRGVVSLASALSIPLLLPSGQEFPYRSLILFITFIVIIVTLVGQGLALPWIVKWVKTDELTDRKPDEQQIMEMELQLITVAIQELTDRHPELIKSNVLLKHKHDFLVDKVAMLRLYSNDESERKNTTDLIARFREVMVTIVERERQELHAFRKMDGYDDDVIALIETRLDLEEQNMIEDAE